MVAGFHSGKNRPGKDAPSEKNGSSPHCIAVGHHLPAELRADRRFAVGMELRFSYRSGNITYLGTGRTRNLSAEAVCFEIDQEVNAGKDIELRIPWPSRLQSICSLELVLRGQIVRKGPSFAVLQLESYEFQTCGDRSFSSSNNCGVTCNIAA
jgi:hypothetical protein